MKIIQCLPFGNTILDLLNMVWNIQQTKDFNTVKLQKHNVQMKFKLAWNSKNDSGHPVAIGVYLYEVATGHPSRNAEDDFIEVIRRAHSEKGIALSVFHTQSDCYAPCTMRFAQNKNNQKENQKMKFKMIYLMMYVFIAMQFCFAQVDGEIVRKTKINNFDELITYIRQTELRDSIGLNKSRFQHFEDVSVFGITYLSDGLKVNGFLLIPKPDGKYPAIIYNRGGSLEWGTLTHHVSSVGLGELAKIAKAGYVVAASQYRGNGGGEGQEEYGGRDINDVLNLFNVLAATPQADTSKVGMFGWSRGGMTTFITLKNIKNSKRIKAVVVGGPGANLLTAVEDRPILEINWSKIIPGYREDQEQALLERSVLFWAEKLPRDIPILMMHGNADWHVKPSETLRLALQFDKYQIPYRLIMFEGGYHAIREHNDEVYRQIIGWFDRFLKNSEEAPVLTMDGKE